MTPLRDSNPRLTKGYPWNFYSEDEQSLLQSAGQNETLNLHMFREDVELAIPYLRNSKPSPLIVKPDSFDARIRLSDIVAQSEFHDIDDRVEDYLRRMVYTFVRYGKAYYEIVPHQHESKIFNFSFVQVYNHTLIEESGLLYQLVPGRGEQTHRVLISQDRLCAIVPDESLSKLISEVTNNLQSIDNEGFYELALENMKLASEGKQQGYIDTAARIQAEKIALAKVTRQVGWNCRGHFDLEISPIYLYERQITWHYFLCELRASAVSGFNSILKKGNMILSEPLNEPFSIEYNILPNRISLDELRKSLRDGVIKLDNVLDELEPHVTA